MRIACSVSRAQSRPRSIHVPRPTIGMSKPLAFTTCIGSPRSVVEEAQQKQRAPRRLAVDAGRRHRARHRALVEVPVEGACLLPIGEPGALHLAQLNALRLVEFLAQAAEGL